MNLSTAAIIEKFQSTPPAWGATTSFYCSFLKTSYFNPRPPHGERRILVELYFAPIIFQSTPPAWGATAKT